MPRHPAQDAALDRSYKRRKAGTREAFADAMDRLLRGEPLYTDGRLTEANLYREAKRSRATLNRYPDIKREFVEAKSNRDKTAPANLADKVMELEETVQLYRRRENEEIRELKTSRHRLAQEGFILHRIIKLLQREKREIELKLQEALRGVRLHLVAADDE